MKSLNQFWLCGVLSLTCLAAAQADYVKGDAKFQIYGGAASVDGHYSLPGVSDDETDYADTGGVIGGQFLYYFRDNPSLAAGFDISHAGFAGHESVRLLSNRLTNSSADSTSGLAILRLSYPKGHLRPY